MPHPNEFGQNYSEIGFAIFDDFRAGSANAFVTVHIQPVNDAPIVYVGGPFNGSIGALVSLRNTSVYDADAGWHPVKLDISLTRGKSVSLIFFRFVLIMLIIFGYFYR